ncbi:MAG TPA: ABC-three component system protein [Ignavibacteriaceae bacterium]|nr:ABC-three component system protein [Ignavibacteriaceae bacterium]
MENDLCEPEEPKSIGLLTNQAILTGTPIPAINRLKIISDDEFEDIIREWVSGYCKSKYIKIRRSGGANDKGRDVIGFINEEGEYENYQCKHYDHPLAPSDIWIEIGKLCYYSFKGDYNLPHKYFFVAPLGVGPTLGDLLQRPMELKTKLFEQWDNKCKKLITSVKEIVLTKKLKDYIESIDFSIFTFLDPQELIEQHKQTNYYATRFGGGLQKRYKPVLNEFTENEYSLRYIEQLFEAYSDHINNEINSLVMLSQYKEQYLHFNRQRECFYWADALNQFSRDHLPPDSHCFEDLKEEIYQGIVDVSNEIHQSGYLNIKKTTHEAKIIQIQSNALLSVVQTQDRIGICHHLANENRLIWVKR